MHCLFDFCCQNPHFSLFVCCRFVNPHFSSFFTIVPWRILLLFCSGFLICILLVTATWFVVFVKFLSILLPRLVLTFFDVKISVLHQFIFAHFAFFTHFLWLCALALLIRSHTSSLQPLASTPYRPMILSGHLDHPCAIPVYISFLYASQNLSFSTIQPSFSLVFFIPPCPCTPAHPYEPIFTRPHPSAPLFACHRKTWCSGKFPPAIAPKQRPVRPFLALLVLFLCPPVPLHLTAPIRTYPHPYIFIFSTLHPVYMCYTCKFKLKNTNLDHLNIKFQTYY